MYIGELTLSLMVLSWPLKTRVQTEWEYSTQNALLNIGIHLICQSIDLSTNIGQVHVRTCAGLVKERIVITQTYQVHQIKVFITFPCVRTMTLMRKFVVKRILRLQLVRLKKCKPIYLGS